MKTKLQLFTINFSTEFGIAINKRKAINFKDCVSRMNKIEFSTWFEIEDENGNSFTRQEWDENNN